MSWAERFAALRGLWVMILLFGVVMGGLYAGIFPPSGAGAAGAFGTLVVALARRKLGWRELREATRTSAGVTCVIFTIIIGGLLFSRFLLVKLVEIAAMTPPVGLNLFAVAAAGKGHVTIEGLIRGIWPYIVLELLILLVLILFSALSTWLPSRMLG